MKRPAELIDEAFLLVAAEGNGEPVERDQKAAIRKLAEAQDSLPLAPAGRRAELDRVEHPAARHLFVREFLPKWEAVRRKVRAEQEG